MASPTKKPVALANQESLATLGAARPQFSFEGAIRDLERSKQRILIVSRYAHCRRSH